MREVNGQPDPKKKKKKKGEDMFPEIITFFCIDKNSSAQGGAIDLVIY
jgi:hypothetical protein